MNLAFETRSRGMRRLGTCGWFTAAACLLGSGLAQAQEKEGPQQPAEDEKQQAEKKTAVDSTPGSSRPPGLSLSPEAPPTPPAPGGRAPSFGAPSDPEAWVFRLGGRISAWGRTGIGRHPAANRPEGDSGIPLHTPPIVAGPDPIYPGTAATLNFQYGNQVVMAFASYEAALIAPEWNGYQRSDKGPRIRSAYVVVTPPPIGAARLRFQVGAFPAHYGAPGPWGWGTMGPVLAIHGYGGIAAVDYDLPSNTALSFEYGVSAVSEVPENFVRGTFTEWPENGLSTIVNHAHAGISSNNKYFAKVHLAHAQGRNMRTYLEDDGDTEDVERGRDGRMQVAALELRWVEDPFGQLGITPVFWNFDGARSVHDGIWWGIDWTAGGREMTSKFLGPQCVRGTRSPGDTYPCSLGTGQIMAVSTEYNFSVARILSHPDPFDGNGPDLRVSVAYLPHWTLKTDYPDMDGASGHRFGATFEHVLLSWLSTTYRIFGERRDAIQIDTDAKSVRGKFTAYNAAFGLALHSDWQSRDRIELIYSRYFYSDFTDNNPAQPLDKEVFTLGASLAF